MDTEENLRLQVVIARRILRAVREGHDPLPEDAEKLAQAVLDGYLYVLQEAFPPDPVDVLRKGLGDSPTR